MVCLNMEINRYPFPGYFLRPSSSGEWSHLIGGDCKLPGAIFPGSNKALIQIASLDLTDSRLSDLGLSTDVLPLLYGGACAAGEGRLCYSVKGGSIQILEYQEGAVYDDFPYSNYPVAFEGVSASLHLLTAQEQAVFTQLNCCSDDDWFELTQVKHQDMSLPQHMVGGEPYLIGGVENASVCPTCAQPMALLATGGNAAYVDSRGFLGNDFVQLVYEFCLKCSTVVQNIYSD